MTDEEMTKEFMEAVGDISANPEMAHVVADEKIAEFLSGLGYEKLSKAFSDAQEEFWYE